ncbi:hypothetical protein [Pseudonocardia acaciae]|uniref:hypothetical protein n=1 Tax=Pseudonocardia acaciae TaxID=551276 RepID=UPI00048C0F25|nr:hypothetical protein [Pseudonocardia acaciae]
MDLTPRFRRPDEEEDEVRRCALDGCDAPLPHVPNRENENRYCTPQHRQQARRSRRSANHN